MEKVIETQELLVNMGPQHPSTHGVLRLLIRTDGELVTDVTPIIGYLHRCAEKIAENLEYEQYVPYTDRLDYLAAAGNNLGYCLAVEKLLKIDIPLRANYIRVILTELNRIASHLIAIGCYGLDLGAFTPFLYCFRERESILDIFEHYCGARLTYNAFVIGGVPNDIDTKFVQMTKDFLNLMRKRIVEYDDLLSFNKIFIERTRGIGIIPPELAIEYGLTGPNLRGSGVAYDVRKTKPYSDYDKFDFDIALGKDGTGILGDSWNRYYVRVEEIRQSCKIIEQAIEAIPSGDLKAKIRKARPPAGEAFVSVENPRGELGYYIISDGSTKPLRVKIRAPSFCNLSILPEISKGVLIADLIAILGSIDIVLGEIDR
jgi:NADH-quinone oxidoreductase subunit D